MTLPLRTLRETLRRPLQEIEELDKEIQMSWQNRGDDPPVDALSLSEALQPGASRLAGQGCLRHEGLYQIDVRGPLAKGTEAVEVLAERVLALYEPPYSAPSVDQSIRLEVTRSEYLQPRHQEGWYVQPLLIYWRTHTFTTT